MVTLILLLVMTVVAVSLLESGHFQSLMARNLQFSERVFEQSQGEIEGQLAKLIDDDANIVSAVSVQGVEQNLTQITADDTALTQSISLEYAGDTRASIGNSIEGGSATGMRLILQSNVELDSQNIHSNQTQALTYVKPK
ncbi:hypothetical protein EDC56_2979 [Sinobacterium caligoides]|uniref:Type 4 fimbrial biogenesis protein PilX N-terminal domain-containing protein n=2 Tax=Sinobacterium caligoides TaxID=933926 RepID=A0A3N2DKK5_9GAMM|nr:hypothetical protein EDC56_2979 [Sinobacterium caligoides]